MRMMRSMRKIIKMTFVQEHENDDQNCEKDFQEGDSVQDGENKKLIFQDEKWNIENEQKEYV